MKKYTYNLFPKPLVITGYILIVLSLAMAFLSIIPIKSFDHFNNPSAPFAFIIIGIIMVFFKSTLILDNKSEFVIKESSLLNMTLSREKINIPKNCNRINVKEKNKTGTGYYRFVLPVSYVFKSYDMFFCSDSGVIRLINTDYKRALKIAEFFKEGLKINYFIEDQNH
jgi:hypothetical protein